MVSSSPWSIGRQPSAIRTGRVTFMITSNLLEVYKTRQQPEITPLRPLGIRSTGGPVAIDLCLTHFQVILNFFTITLFVIYLNLNFTNALYIYEQKKSATDKNNHRNKNWSSLHSEVSYSLHRYKKVNFFSFFFLNGLFDKNISLQLAYKILSNCWTGQYGNPATDVCH